MNFCKETVGERVASGFRLLVPLGWLVLWKERNARTLERTPSTPALLMDTIEHEIALWCAAGFKPLVALDARRR